MTSSQFAKFDNATDWTFAILWVALIGIFVWCVYKETPKEKR